MSTLDTMLNPRIVALAEEQRALVREVVADLALIAPSLAPPEVAPENGPASVSGLNAHALVGVARARLFKVKNEDGPSLGEEGALAVEDAVGLLLLALVDEHRRAGNA